MKGRTWTLFLFMFLVVMSVLSTSFAAETTLKKFGFITYPAEAGSSCPIEQISISDDLCYGRCDRLAEQIGDNYYVTIGPYCAVLPFGVGYCSGDGCSLRGKASPDAYGTSFYSTSEGSPPSLIDVGLLFGGDYVVKDYCSDNSIYKSGEEGFYEDVQLEKDRPLPTHQEFLERYFIKPKFIEMLDNGDGKYSASYHSLSDDSLHNIDFEPASGIIYIDNKAYSTQDYTKECRFGTLKVWYTNRGGVNFVVSNFKLANFNYFTLNPTSYTYLSSLGSLTCETIERLERESGVIKNVGEGYFVSEEYNSMYNYIPEYWGEVDDNFKGTLDLMKEIFEKGVDWEVSPKLTVPSYLDSRYLEYEVTAYSFDQNFCTNGRLSSESKGLYTLKGQCNSKDLQTDETCKDPSVYPSEDDESKYAGRAFRDDLSNDDNYFCSDFTCHACYRGPEDMWFSGEAKESEKLSFGPFCPTGISVSNSYVYGINLTLKPGAYPKEWTPGFVVYIEPDYDLGVSKDDLENVQVNISNVDPIGREVDHPLCEEVTVYGKDGNILTADEEGWYTGAKKVVCKLDWTKHDDPSDALYYLVYGGPTRLIPDSINLTSYFRIKMKEGDNSKAHVNFFIDMGVVGSDSASSQGVTPVLHEYDCYNGIDDDGDGAIDQDDDDCKEVCNNGEDDDHTVSSKKFVEIIKGFYEDQNDECYQDYSCALQKAIQNDLLTDTDPTTGVDRDDWKCHEYSCTDGSDEYDPNKFPEFFNDNDGNADGKDPDCWVYADFSCLRDYDPSNPYTTSKLKDGAEVLKLVAIVKVKDEDGNWHFVRSVDLGTSVVENYINFCPTSENDEGLVSFSGANNGLVSIDYLGTERNFRPMQSQISPGLEKPIETPEIQPIRGPFRIVPIEPADKDIVTGDSVELKADVFNGDSNYLYRFYVKDVTNPSEGVETCDGSVKKLEDKLEASCTFEGLKEGHVYEWYVGAYDKDVPVGTFSDKSLFRVSPGPGSICYDYKGNEIPCSSFATKKYIDRNLVTLPLSFKYGASVHKTYESEEPPTPKNPSCGDYPVVQYFPEEDRASDFLFAYKIPIESCTGSDQCKKCTIRCGIESGGILSESKESEILSNGEVCSLVCYEENGDEECTIWCNPSEPEVSCSCSKNVANDLYYDYYNKDGVQSNVRCKDEEGKVECVVDYLDSDTGETKRVCDVIHDKTCDEERCVSWDSNDNCVPESFIAFENRTLVNMSFKFKFDIDYNALISLYSNEDRVPMLIGRAI